MWELSTINQGDNLTGTTPKFVDMADQDYHLVASSDCVNAGDDLPADVLPDHSLQNQYVPHPCYTVRSHDSLIDMGAFELGWDCSPTTLCRGARNLEKSG